jgi:hypothetical protein
MPLCITVGLIAYAVSIPIVFLIGRNYFSQDIKKLGYVNRSGLGFSI